MAKINLVRDLAVDPENIPTDFAKQVRRTFEEYTECTKPDYRHEDKLMFIDVCVKCLRGDKSEEEIVKREILEHAEFQLDEYGELPDANDYNCLEFMEQCVGAGCESAKLHFNGIYGNLGEAKMRVLDIILTALYSE